MQQLESYLEGKWVQGSGGEETLVNPATEEALAVTSTEGLDRAAALSWARTTGGPALRKMTFADRAGALKAIAKLIHENRDELLDLSIANGGNTRNDGKFDVDGAAGTFHYYAGLGADVLGDRHLLPDGEWEQLGRSPRFFGHHVMVPRQGVAALVNAYNFPAWGMAEKAAVAWLAGMPVMVKPASSTALVAERLVRLIVDAKVLPDGALSLLTGLPGDLIDHLGPQDVLAFTGSSTTGAALRAQMAPRGVHTNVEADSLNAAILGPDVDPDDDLFDMFVLDVTRDLRQKAGQKCTALRRILVPEELLEAAQERLVEAVGDLTVGNPAERSVNMGPLVTAAQRDRVLEAMGRLRQEAKQLTGHAAAGSRPGVPDGKGFFVEPSLFLAENAAAGGVVHSEEIFGPVSTLVPYDGEASSATEIMAYGRGSLVSAVYSGNRKFVATMVTEGACHNGRLHLAHPKIGDETLGPGAVLPQLVHGGPGRAGAGEELGGLRALHHYMQRTAVQGYRPLLEKLIG